MAKTNSKAGQLITGRLTTKRDGTCGNAGCTTPAIDAGTIAWYVRGEWTGERLRCIGCGPHPGARVPPKFRKTKAEGGVYGPRAPGSETPPAVSIDNADLAILRMRVNDLSDEVAALRARFAPTVLEYRAPNAAARVVNGAHACLAEVSDLVLNCGFQNVYVVGPAGSGKTTLAAQLAELLGRDFAFLSLSGGTSESKLVGQLRPVKDGSWVWISPSFVRIFRDGGVFLLDEMDAAEPNVLVTINAALANGKLEIDGQIITRHPDCVIIGAANTYGTGADAVYVGRNPLDGATMDRFVGSIVEVEYDRQIEEQIASAAGEAGMAFAKWVWGIRDRANEARLRRIVGTRMIQAGVKHLNGGRTMERTKAKMLTGWTQDEKRKIGM